MMIKTKRTISIGTSKDNKYFLFFQTPYHNIMSYYIKARTNKINCFGTQQQLTELQEMFPFHPLSDQDTQEALNKYFNPADKQHVRFLQQSCFKTPLASVAEVYEKFRRQKHPGINQPLISGFYDNNSFVSLKQIQKWLDGQGKYPSIVQVEGLKQQIADALFSIVQEFGYIPNLQRFLLYFPSYLVKILKFKNRFFQQINGQTSQVTYLNSKNCCFAGIIAAIEMGCPYMISRMIKMFIVRDGNLSWVKDRKYPEQFKSLFTLFRKMSVAPWSINEKDLIFKNSNWNRQVYFDYILAGTYVMSMSTICHALGLFPQQPCQQYFPLEKMIKIKKEYDSQKYETIKNKKQLAQQIKQLLNGERQLNKQFIKQISEKQVQPYMKEIASKLNSQDMYFQFNKLLSHFGIQQYEPINLKIKDNSFFHRNREAIQKGLQQQRKSDKFQDQKLQCFKSFCLEGSNMTFNNFGKKQQNTRVFRRLIQIMTYHLCGYHNENFDYKKNIKLNIDLTMPLKFYVRLLSLSPLYINRQVLLQINHETGKGWIQCFDLGHLAIMVAQNKSKLLISSIQSELFQ